MAQAKKIALALQGGGAHGAFTWGVLDGLLEEVAKGKIELVGISGASVGALNATALTYGFHDGASRPGPATALGRRMADAARIKLQHLWETVARAAFWGGNPLVAAIGLAASWNIDDSAAARWSDVADGINMPGESGLAGYLNAVLREVLPELPAILAVPAAKVPMLIVAATDVEQCCRQLFVDGAVSPDAIRASAAVPTAGQPVAIGGHLYWDGGYMGNPPLMPLVDRLRQADADDLVLVSIKPIARPGAPQTPRQVANRINEITHNASLVHEVNAIETINHLIDAGMIKDPPAGQHPFRRVNLHRVHDDAALADLGVYSKEAPAWDFLRHLHDLGAAAFRRMWPDIEANLGKTSSWDTAAVCDHVLARSAITRA